MASLVSMSSLSWDTHALTGAIGNLVAGRNPLLTGQHPTLLETRCDLHASAEEFFINNLRRGVHPDCIEWEVLQELEFTCPNDCKYRFLQALLDIHARLRLAGSFVDLPSLAEVDAAERILDKRIVLEQLIRERFERETLESLLTRNHGTHYY
jgi:hypothetical protein